MDIKNELKLFKSKIDIEIEQYLDEVAKEAKKNDTLLVDMLGYAKAFILGGGKRLRPALMYHGYLAAGGKEYKKALETCVSIELVHAFLLIHDDIIDRDHERHGKDTLHYHYAKVGKRFFRGKDYEHFGSSMAIIAGDLIAALGSQRLFTSEFQSDRVVQALNKLQSIVSLTTVGEARDVYMEYTGRATEEEVLRMYENKTARYTLEGPLHLGAILAGSNKELIDSMSQYAVPLGIAFQIQDDILEIYGDTQKIGKPEGSDIREGKMTILIIKALEKSTRAQKKILRSAFGNAQLTKKDLRAVKKILIDTGAVQYSQALAETYVEEGQKALEKMPSQSKKAKDFFRAIAGYMMQREI